MNNNHKLILECIPFDGWITACDIVVKVTEYTPSRLRSYTLPMLCQLNLIERVRGRPSRYRRLNKEVKKVENIYEVIVSIEKKCLTCSKTFKSEGKHNHICSVCFETNKRMG